MTISTSGSTNWSHSRDTIIQRTLRIVGGIGSGETPTATQYTESAVALNDLAKAWAADGMPLWALKNYTITLVAGTGTYAIGVGATGLNAVAPLKIIQAWTVDSSNLSRPITIIGRDTYDNFGDKTGTGDVTMIWYQTPGAGVGGTTAELAGTITTYLIPLATSPLTLNVIGQRPFEDFDASADTPDFPSYWYNAIIWGLARDLSYEYGNSFAERSMISKMADQYKDEALGFGTENASMFIQPTMAFGAR